MCTGECTEVVSGTFCEKEYLFAYRRSFLTTCWQPVACLTREQWKTPVTVRRRLFIKAQRNIPKVLSTYPLRKDHKKVFQPIRGGLGLRTSSVSLLTTLDNSPVTSVAKPVGSAKGAGPFKGTCQGSILSATVTLRYR